MNVILKGEQNSPSCVITPPLVTDPMYIHNLKSGVSGDYELEEYTITGDCAITDYQITIASSTGNDFSWLVPLARGVQVPASVAEA